MTPTILGLDVGGANLKAATSDRRAAAVPFALWKQPDRLPAALAELVARFPDADELAVTMTGELCDCFQTKREGVTAIITAVRNVARSRPIHVWSTDDRFLNSEEALAEPLKVAAANWHALATYVGRFVADRPAVLIDIGSTTTDVIPLFRGEVVARGKTDPERMEASELVYTGMTRTPLCALMGSSVAAELFATTLDVYLLLGRLPENPDNAETADGRPATRSCAHARVARMLCSDPELMTEEQAVRFAEDVARRQQDLVDYAVRTAAGRAEGHREKGDESRLDFIVSGSAEMLAREAAARYIRQRAGDRWAKRVIKEDELLSLSDRLGPELSACAPAYAVAALAQERRP